MADQKLTDLTVTTTPLLTDIGYIVVDPSGTPLDRKITWDTLRTLFNKLVSKTANYTAVTADRFIAVDATSGAVTILLTAVASLPVGFRLSVKKVDSGGNTVTIDGAGSETIDGATTLVLATQYSTAVIVNTGTAWLIESKYVP